MISELDQNSIVADALELSDAPENWPDGVGDLNVTSLTDAELRSVIEDAQLVADEDGRDPHAAAVEVVKIQINKARLWNCNDD